MGDPLRMLDSDVPPQLRALLEAGRGAEPDPSLVEATLHSLRAADLGIASSSLSRVSSSVAAPVAAGILAIGALAVVTWMMMEPAPWESPPPAVLALPQTTAPSEEQPTGAADVTEASPVEPLARAEREPASSAEPMAGAGNGVPNQRVVSLGTTEPKVSSPSRAGEAAAKLSRSSTLAQRDLVLRARAALDGGAPHQTLRILTGYESSFQDLRFVPEVLSLRMQAQERLGRVAAAKELARRIVAAYPRSSQAGRARQVLAEGEPN